MTGANSIGVFTFEKSSGSYAEALFRNFELPRGGSLSFDSLVEPKGYNYDVAIVVVCPSDDPAQLSDYILYLQKAKGIQSILIILPEGEHELAHKLQSIQVDAILNEPIDMKALHKTINHICENKPKRYVRFSKEQNDTDFVRLLINNNIVTKEQLHTALNSPLAKDKSFPDLLADLQFITEEQRKYYQAIINHVPMATAQQYSNVILEVVSLIPERIAKKECCIAIEILNDVLVVAMEDTTNLRLLDKLRDVTNLKIMPVLGKREDILTSVERYYRNISSQKEVHNLMPDLNPNLEFVVEKEERVDLASAASAGEELGIVKLVNIIIANAVTDRASDIHVEPLESTLLIRYRIDGDLQEVMTEPLQMSQAILTRIKILSKLDIAERRLPQDGRMVVKFSDREVDIRVSILPTVHGEKAVLRILDKDAFKKSTANLGFTPYDLNLFTEQVQKPYGMVIVTGPTGSGKSTTLYSAIQQIKSPKKNIITVEDPVEFHMDGINQINVNTKINLTFGIALRSILRQDPDIILIGEIRDEETADIAIKMALTGHLVFSTLHTNNAASAIARFVDIGIPPLLLGSSLNMIVAQRLVRTICTHCKSSYEAPPEVVDQLHLDTSKSYLFYKGEGCVTCNGTGYLGRSGIFEMLPITRDIRRLILKNRSTMEIEDQARKEGMKTLRQAGIDMLLRGETTIEQVIAVTNDDESD